MKFSKKNIKIILSLFLFVFSFFFVIQFFLDLILLNLFLFFVTILFLIFFTKYILKNIESSFFNEKNNIIKTESDINIIEKNENESLNLNETILENKKNKDEFNICEKEMTALINNEIKTPLISMTNILESLCEGAAGDLNQEIEKNIKFLYAYSGQLLKLLDDILDFSDIKNNNLKLFKTKIDIYSISKLVIYSCDNFIENKDLKIINKLDKNLPFLFGDENRISQVLYNLIVNAIKYTEKGEIVLESEIKDNEIEISVKDTGIGIDYEFQKNIFQGFKIDSEQNNLKTNGFGLLISKKLIEMQNGKIWLEKSGKNKGSEFRFTLPLYKEIKSDNKIIPIAKKEVEPKKIKGYKILVVDDEFINIQVIINYLSIEGYEIISASNGMEALEIIEKNKPDIVLLDIMMPIISGYEVCEKIRKKYTAEELPVIMLSVKNKINDIVNGIELGANDYITKPINRVELISRIDIVLKLKEAEKILIEKSKEFDYEKNRNNNKANEYIILAEKITKVILSDRDMKRIFENICVVISILLKKEVNKIIYMKYYSDSEAFNLERYIDFNKELYEDTDKMSIENININDIKVLKEKFIKQANNKKFLKIFFYENEKLKKDIFESKEINFLKYKKIDEKLKTTFNLKEYKTFIIKYDKNLYGLYVIDYSNQNDVKNEMLKYIIDELAFYVKKLEVENESILKQNNNEFRCKNCNTKLSEYKGNIDFLEIKCPVCNTLNKISKGTVPLKKN